MDAVCSDFLLLLLNLVIINHAILLVTLSGMLKDFMMIRKMMLIAMGMLLSISLAVGQQVCSALVEQALQAVDDNCNDLIRNTACYAYNQVQATFFQDVSNDFFSNPADRADLTYLDTIQTTPLDEDNDLWGIAMMSVQANVPNTLPGQAVIFMLMGDVQVENAVAPEDVFEPADPINVMTLVASLNIRLAPSATGFVVGVAPLGTAFEADGLSVDGEWVRIIFDDQPSWISRNLVSSESSLAELPVISDVNRTPMQAFYFSTGSGVSTCNEAPDSLMIQGPNSLEVAINANGVDINIGSTIVLESNGERQVSITAINGYARVENIRIPGGFTIDAQTDEQGNIRPETLAGLRPMEDDKIERFKSLEKIDGDTVNYQVRIPTRVEINVVQYELEEGQKREDIKARCVENGLSAEQCRGFVGNDTDQGTIYQRCVDAGLSAKQCRGAIGNDGSTDDDDTTAIGSGAILDRCQQAGFETLESCRTEFSGESDERINICTVLGYNSRQSCRDAFPEDVVDKVISCVSRGFTTKAECDASDSGET
jgi:hypothetical protein